MLMDKILKKLIALVYGLGYTVLGTGLGGIFFSTSVGLGLIVTGVGLFVISIAFIIDIINETMDKGT